MPNLTICDSNGVEHHLEVENGTNVAGVAMEKGIEGIDAECAGACYCATCHCYVSADWLRTLPEVSSDEDRALDRVEQREENSRLTCQLVMSDALDGLYLRLDAD